MRALTLHSYTITLDGISRPVLHLCKSWAQAEGETPFAVEPELLDALGKHASEAGLSKYAFTAAAVRAAHAVIITWESADSTAYSVLVDDKKAPEAAVWKVFVPQQNGKDLPPACAVVRYGKDAAGAHQVTISPTTASAKAVPGTGADPAAETAVGTGAGPEARDGPGIETSAS